MLIAAEKSVKVLMYVPGAELIDFFEPLDRVRFDQFDQDRLGDSESAVNFMVDDHGLHKVFRWMYFTTKNAV